MYMVFYTTFTVSSFIFRYQGNNILVYSMMTVYTFSAHSLSTN